MAGRENAWRSLEWEGEDKRGARSARCVVGGGDSVMKMMVGRGVRVGV